MKTEAEMIAELENMFTDELRAIGLPESEIEAAIRKAQIATDNLTVEVDHETEVRALAAEEGLDPDAVLSALRSRAV